jgi:ABC-type multidrug transport system fused ATPase/permease subunit
MHDEYIVYLSDDQIQRIAISRAMLKNSPMLLMDEATSVLGVESNCTLQEVCHHLMKSHTCVVVTMQ